MFELSVRNSDIPRPSCTSKNLFKLIYLQNQTFNFMARLLIKIFNPFKHLIKHKSS